MKFDKDWYNIPLKKRGEIAKMLAFTCLAYFVVGVILGFSINGINKSSEIDKLVREKESALRNWEEMANLLDEHSLTGMSGEDTISCCEKYLIIKNNYEYK